MKKKDEMLHFNCIARLYDKKMKKFETLSTAKFELLNKSLSNRSSILEIGCGPSQYLALLSKYNNGVDRIVGLDLSLEMLKIATASMKKGFKNSGSLVLADCEYLPFRNGYFEALYCVNLLHHVVTKSMTTVVLLKEFIRVLTPGGILLAIEPNALSLLWKLRWRFCGLSSPKERCGLARGFTPFELKTTFNTAGLKGVVASSHMAGVTTTIFPTSLWSKFLYRLELILEKLPVLCCLHPYLFVRGEKNEWSK